MKTEEEKKLERIGKISGAITVVLLLVVFYYIGLPILDFIWTVIAFPFEAMTNINITGGSQLWKMEPDVSPLNIFLGVIGSLAVAGFIVRIFLAIKG